MEHVASPVPAPQASPEPAATLALALIAASEAPLLLIDDRLAVVSASASFARTFALSPDKLEGVPLAALGDGEWNVPQLHTLLRATLAGTASVDAYEMDLVREGRDDACLVVNAHRLDLGVDHQALLVLTVTDITAARAATKVKDALVREKQVLLQELQHRVANSLQIIASVLMQSARRVSSEESRTHLYDAHNRVMSIATLQKQLAVASTDDVELRPYLRELCASIAASMIDDQSRVTLQSTADDTKVPASISVSIGLVVTELVINAIKHAFPGRTQHGAIRVAYAPADTGGGWQLSVTDDGVGIAAGDGQGKPGLGTGIVDAIARQLGATVSTTDCAPGTRVVIERAA